MKLLLLLGVLALVRLGSSAPTTNDNEIVVIDSDFFPNEIVKYISQHDIVDILVPLNALNFDDDDDEEEVGDKSYVFFIEADTDASGKRVDQGLYVLQSNVTKKLLDNGKDFAAGNDDSKDVYFAAKDGLYNYNVTSNTALKYGTITDSLIGVAKVNSSDIIYVLTGDNVVYTVTEKGTKKTKVEGITYAEQIVLDYNNNLYFKGANKDIYVLTSAGVKKIEGLPSAAYVKMIRPPFLINNGVPVLLDDTVYIAYETGTSELSDFKFAVKPTAIAVEATLINYLGYNKKIYEYNILAMMLGEVLPDLKSLVDDKSDAIQNIATRSRSGLVASAETATEKS